MNRLWNFLLDSTDTDKVLDELLGETSSLMTKRLRDMREPEKCDKLLISIIDNGVGIKKKNMEPYFTTLGLIGSGRNFNKSQMADGLEQLSLYVCQKIVKRLGGQMAVKSKSGRGTMINLTMPIEIKN